MSRISERPRQTVKVHYSDPASTREYAVWDCSTRDEAVTLVAAASPAIDTVNAVARFRDSIEVKEHGGGCWEAVVKYVRNPNSLEMNFDIGTGSTKVVYSKETIAGYDAVNGPTNFTGGATEMGTDFPDFGRGIGFNGTSFEGVDVEIAKMEITINKKLKFSTLTGGYIQTLFEMCQTTNNAEFTFDWKGQILTFAEGSLRFRGARIKQDSDDNLDISYSFLYSRGTLPEDNITIGETQTLEKQGHQYLWVYFDETVEAGRKVKVPIAVYVERVYDTSDFADLLL